MEETTTTGSPATTLDQKAGPSRPLLSALIFTSLLYFTVSPTLPRTNVIASKPPQTSARLLQSVSNAVVQDVSQHSGLSASQLRIVESQPHTWQDDCLGLGGSGVVCSQQMVPGWQVTVASQQQRWIYHTNASGSVVKLAQSVVATQ
jgi:hypothetical protein